MSKKILITGSNGLLGQKLVYRLLTEPGVEIIATSKGPNRLIKQDGYAYQSLDITIPAEVDAAINKFKPNVVINTAAMTNVDACETAVEECHKMNVDAVQYLINALKKQPNNPLIIHLSTDFIFDGKNGPYKETDAVHPPKSVYCESKFESEKVVQASGMRWAILRTVLVYGVVDNMSRSNIVLWAKDSLTAGKKINVVDDQFRTPTLAEDLAEGCVLTAMKGATGIYHISGKDFMHIFEMVNKIADFWHLDKSLINPAKTSDIKQPAERPLRTGFILDKAMNELGYKPHSFTDGLAIVDKQLKEKETLSMKKAKQYLLLFATLFAFTQVYAQKDTVHSLFKPIKVYVQYSNLQWEVGYSGYAFNHAYIPGSSIDLIGAVFNEVNFAIGFDQAGGNGGTIYTSLVQSYSDFYFEVEPLLFPQQTLNFSMPLKIALSSLTYMDSSTVTGYKRKQRYYYESFATIIPGFFCYVNIFPKLNVGVGVNYRISLSNTFLIGSPSDYSNFSFSLLARYRIYTRNKRKISAKHQEYYAPGNRFQ